MKMRDSFRILLPRPLIALPLAVVSLAMGQSHAPAKLELSERQAASMQSAGLSTGSADRTGVYEITVSAITVWTDTGLDLRRGDRVLFRAAGKVELPLGQVAGPQGMQSVSVETPPPAGLPLSTVPRAALVARIGGADTGTLLLVGAQKQINVSRPGRLFLGVNEHEPGKPWAPSKFRWRLGGAARIWRLGQMKPLLPSFHRTYSQIFRGARSIRGVSQKIW